MEVLIILKKLKNYIKNEMIGFLGINTIESKLTELTKNTNNEFYNHSIIISRLFDELSKSQDKIDGLHNTLSNVVSFGSDIRVYEGNSWAVVCIEGKTNVVKFYNLSHKDGYDVLKLLKSFEGSRYVNDTPMGYIQKELFVDW